MAKFLGHDVERQRILVLVHKAGIWPEELLSPTLFGFITNKILTKREFFVLEEMIKLNTEGLDEKECITNIAIMARITKKRVSNYCDSIKRKLRNGLETDPRRALRLKFYVKEDLVNGKGDKDRPRDQKKYSENHEKIFGKKCRYNHQHDKDCETEDPEATTEE